jgi:hypothetical protein
MSLPIKEAGGDGLFAGKPAPTKAVLPYLLEAAIKTRGFSHG